ncbi:MAG: DUF4417 domain-containing protein [Oscillospiraceae bacterium]
MRIDENLNIQLEIESSFGFPIIKAEEVNCNSFIGFNFALSSKGNEECGVHFFIDDYQFARVWKNPIKYISVLKRFKCVISPDFSLYCDMPKVMQMYNHYRKQMLGAFFQANLIPTIPCVGWSDKSSFEWCFCGLPRNSMVAVSSVGTQKHKETKLKFLEGYNKMLEVLNPNKILFFGTVPTECKGNIISVNSFTDKFLERR